MSADVAEVKESVGVILGKHKRDRSLLVAVLQDVQAEFNYLPREALTAVSDGLGVPLSQVYGVATFFKAFSLKPRGRHTIHVCLGTACHVRGAVRVLDRMEDELCVCAGQNTPDMKFTLETVNCVGACALGPVVVVDGEYVGQMSTEKVKPLLKGCP